MNIYLWRHNRTYHSHSMIQEPCVNQEFYLDALAIVAANTLDEALQKLEAQGKGWRIEDLRELEPKIFTLEEAEIIFTDIRG